MKKFVKAVVGGSHRNANTSGSKRKQPGKRSSKPSDRAAVESHPTYLSGTGRGNPACPQIEASRRINRKVVTTIAENGSVRATWDSINYTAILRWCGSQGWSWQRAAYLLSRLGIASRQNTIVSQVNSGANPDPKKYGVKQTLRGPIPKLTRSQAAELEREAPAGKEFSWDD